MRIKEKNKRLYWLKETQKRKCEYERKTKKKIRALKQNYYIKSNIPNIIEEESGVGDVNLWGNSEFQLQSFNDLNEESNESSSSSSSSGSENESSYIGSSNKNKTNGISSEERKEIEEIHSSERLIDTSEKYLEPPEPCIEQTSRPATENLDPAIEISEKQSDTSEPIYFKRQKTRPSRRKKLTPNLSASVMDYSHKQGYTTEFEFILKFECPKIYKTFYPYYNIIEVIQRRKDEQDMQRSIELSLEQMKKSMEVLTSKEKRKKTIKKFSKRIAEHTSLMNLKPRSRRSNKTKSTLYGMNNQKSNKTSLEGSSIDVVSSLRLKIQGIRSRESTTQEALDLKFSRREE